LNKSVRNNKEEPTEIISRDKLAGEYQFYQDIIQALRKTFKPIHKNIKEEKARALEWALNCKQKKR